MPRNNNTRDYFERRAGRSQRGAEPADSGLVVAMSAVALHVESSNIEFADGIAVLGRREKEFEGFVKIFGDTVTVLVEESKIIFGGGEVVQSRGLIVLQGDGDIERDAFAMLVRGSRGGIRLENFLGRRECAGPR